MWNKWNKFATNTLFLLLLLRLVPSCTWLLNHPNSRSWLLLPFGLIQQTICMAPMRVSSCKILGISFDHTLRASWHLKRCIITPSSKWTLVLKVRIGVLLHKLIYALSHGILYNQSAPLDQAFFKELSSSFDPTCVQDIFKFYNYCSIIGNKWKLWASHCFITNLLLKQWNMENRM